MLDESSYLTAMYLYCGAACLAILCLLWWLRRSWSPTWLAFGALLAAALLLTPAFPQEGVSTLAPALIVAAFQFLTYDLEAAEHALRPLIFMLGLAVVVTLLLRFTVFRSRGSNQPVSPVTGKSDTR
ncbi:MAG: hypothetical protein V7742_15170 [Halioglobus sp.]